MKFRTSALFTALVLLASVSAAFAQSQQFRVTSRVANVRLEATTNSQVIDQVNAGTVLPVVEDAEDWVKVQLPTDNGLKRTGFIYKSLGTIMTVSVPDAPASDAKTASAKPKLIEKPMVKPVSKPAHVIKTKTQLTPPALPQPQTVGTVGQPRKFGVGAQIGFGGGFVPMVLYDFNKNYSALGLFELEGAGTAVNMGVLRKFPQPAGSGNLSFEPFAGGGFSLINVNFGPLLGSESYHGFFGAGGTFVQLKKYPRLKFSGTVYFIQFSVPAEFGTSIALRGIAGAVGAMYYF